MDKQTKRRNFTNFERNLAMMMIYLHVKLMNSIGQTVFESGNKNVDGHMDGQRDKKRTNGQTNGWNYTNFKRNLAKIVIYVPSSMNLIGQTVLSLLFNMYGRFCGSDKDGKPDSWFLFDL